ncbi:hypothetical protein [Paucibacter sp. KBW04]|uniref:hypothetical protein n=1 Tax=Paucibacter sp. KBW04 TaxID=2153361 RepID=UPI000F58F13C|nr:hypothetical protein [Paucibacter sp. KBW04]
MADMNRIKSSLAFVVASAGLLGASISLQVGNSLQRLSHVSNGQVLPADQAAAKPFKGPGSSFEKRLDRLIGGGGGFRRSFNYPAPGWSVAHDRRQARKRRNQLRNKRAHRS